MPEVASSIMERVNKLFPTIELKWNKALEKYEIIENYFQGAIKRQRVIGCYENADGSATPVIGDHLIEWLNMADTKKWPLADRLAAYRKIWDEAKARKEKEFRSKISDFYVDNAAYFTSSSRFFMDPKSMPESRSKYFPSQERVLKRWGVL